MVILVTCPKPTAVHHPLTPASKDVCIARLGSKPQAGRGPATCAILSCARQSTYQCGYIPARTPSPVTPVPVPMRQSPPRQQQQPPTPQLHQSLPIYRRSAPSVPSYQQLPTIPTVMATFPMSPLLPLRSGSHKRYTLHQHSNCYAGACIHLSQLSLASWLLRKGKSSALSTVATKIDGRVS
ncbi:hypothetical protein AX14_001815 [Amanita brunnescens Koide BX004]|nr:hypothetical protein AX14_001815 [Amanita brunnescens Koide BX004]